MIRDKEILKKQILYSSEHRGTKEMDLLLGNFVRKHVNDFNIADLKDLQQLLLIEDEIIHNWYFQNSTKNNVPKTKVSEMWKKFRI